MSSLHILNKHPSVYLLDHLLRSIVMNERHDAIPWL